MVAILALAAAAILGFAGATLTGAGGKAMAEDEVAAGRNLARAGELLVAAAVTAAFFAGMMAA